MPSLTEGREFVAVERSSSSRPSLSEESYSPALAPSKSVKKKREQHQRTIVSFKRRSILKQKIKRMTVAQRIVLEQEYDRDMNWSRQKTAEIAM